MITARYSTYSTWVLSLSLALGLPLGACSRGGGGPSGSNVDGSSPAGGDASVALYDLSASSADLRQPTPGGGPLWQKQLGATSSGTIKAIATDSAGNTIVAGSFNGQIDLGGGPLTSTFTDGFVAKLGPNGQHLWTKHYGSNQNVAGYAVTTDKSGNVYLLGRFGGIANFGGGNLTSAGADDIFVVKLDAGGAFLWQMRYGGGSDDVPLAATTDGDGNLLFTGNISSPTDFGGGPLTPAGHNDAFVVKLAPDGSHQWSKRYGGAAEDQSTAIACDGNNNVVFTGIHFSPIDFGGGVVTPAATAYNAFVVKLSAAGAYVWAKSFGNAGGTTATGVATDSTGSVLFGGGFGRTLDFGGGPVTSKGDINSFLVKFSPTGAFAWALRGGGHDGTSGGDLANGLAVDPSDQVVLVGSLTTTDADFGGPVLATAGGSDLFLAKYTAAGSYLWSQRLGGVKDDSPTGVVTAPNGDLLVSGTTTGSLDPGGGVITAASTLDGFILRRAP